MPERALYLAFLVAISVVNSIGQVMMRWGGRQPIGSHTPAPAHLVWVWQSRWWLLGIVVTWVCGLGWAWCLRKLPLATAVPLYSGLVYVLSVLGGTWFLKERISTVQALGVATILIGVLLVTFSAGSPAQVRR
jgi:multidrug transporter EmrE-like cation transporter